MNLWDAIIVTRASGQYSLNIDFIHDHIHGRYIIVLSYMLSREQRVLRNWYSRLLFTSEGRLCANLHVQEQSTNMTS